MCSLVGANLKSRPREELKWNEACLLICCRCWDVAYVYAPIRQFRHKIVAERDKRTTPLLLSYGDGFGGGLGSTRRMVSDGVAEEALLFSLDETDLDEESSCSSEMDDGKDEEEVVNEDVNRAQRDLGTWRLGVRRSVDGGE